jgi:hypothetical protein
MTTANFQDLLDQVEFQIGQLSQALTAHQTNDLATASAGLQAIAIEFSKLLQQVPVSYRWESVLQLRVKKIAAMLASQRESLIRRATTAERALGSLVPSIQLSTYSPFLGVHARKPYGSAGCRSGEFQTSTA